MGSDGYRTAAVALLQWSIASIVTMLGVGDVLMHSLWICCLYIRYQKGNLVRGVSSGNHIVLRAK